jgi:ribosomal-protein-alanine N-acetyltransferase
MERLETPRLILRDLDEKDLDDFFEYASVPGVGENAGWPHHQSIEESEKILRQFIHDDDNWALELKRNGKMVGTIGLHLASAAADFPKKKCIEIGYVLSKDYWGQGLMPEGVKAVIRYLFEKEKYDLVFIAHYDFNERSKKVILKCGLHYLKTIPDKPVPLLGKKYNELVYLLTAEDFKSSNLYR